jgi:hypothetical protein
MRTISLTAFRDMLKKTIADNNIQTSEDDGNYYVQVMLWDEPDRIEFKCIVYTLNDSFSGNGDSPEVAIQVMLAKMNELPEAIIQY